MKKAILLLLISILSTHLFAAEISPYQVETSSTATEPIERWNFDFKSKKSGLPVYITLINDNILILDEFKVNGYDKHDFLRGVCNLACNSNI